MVEKKMKIAVLMSTYNGGVFLDEQIQSVLSQEGHEIHLFIRDDGSTDDTLRILDKYTDRATIIKGSNLGVGGSFMEVLYSAGRDFDYYAFCDQDDVWLKDKLARAVDMLADYNVPVLYASNQMLVDQEKNKLGKRYSGNVDCSCQQILNSNLISGCTMVWNRELNDLLVNPECRPSKDLLHKRIHDVWVAAVASTAGKIIYDPEAYILYRQHSNNVVGVRKENIFRQWKKKIDDPSLRNGRSDLAKELLEKYGQYIQDPEKKELLRTYAYYRNQLNYKIKLLRDPEIARHSGEPKLQLSVKIICNLF